VKVSNETIWRRVKNGKSDEHLPAQERGTSIFVFPFYIERHFLGSRRLRQFRFPFIFLFFLPTTDSTSIADG